MVLFLAFLIVPASAQSGDREKPQPYALIFGTVWDPDGRPLYAIKVKIRRADEKKVRWELYSDHTGEFAQRVPVGKADYVVWADVKGYKLPSGKKLRPVWVPFPHPLPLNIPLPTAILLWASW